MRVSPALHIQLILAGMFSSSVQEQMWSADQGSPKSGEFGHQDSSDGSLSTQPGFRVRMRLRVSVRARVWFYVYG